MIINKQVEIYQYHINIKKIIHNLKQLMQNKYINISVSCENK